MTVVLFAGAALVPPKNDVDGCIAGAVLADPNANPDGCVDAVVAAAGVDPKENEDG